MCVVVPYSQFNLVLEKLSVARSTRTKRAMYLHSNFLGFLRRTSWRPLRTAHRYQADWRHKPQRREPVDVYSFVNTSSIIYDRRHDIPTVCEKFHCVVHSRRKRPRAWLDQRAPCRQWKWLKCGFSFYPTASSWLHTTRGPGHTVSWFPFVSIEFPDWNWNYKIATRSSVVSWQQLLSLFEPRWKVLRHNC